MELYNKLSAKQRATLIEEAGSKRLTLSFYKYHLIKNCQLFRDHLYLAWSALDVLGRIYIAKEGINAQLSVPSENFKKFKQSIDEVSFLEEVRLNIAIEHDDFAFLKLKIKLRKNIVADGLDSASIDLNNNGKHLNAKDFNSMIESPETLLVDMRNHYESEVGHFEGAILPETVTFKEELPLVKKLLKGKEKENVLLYCTGGIRCEKASAYLKHYGFKNVHQLSGGIVKYTSETNELGIKNYFKGKNFVFDNRLGERISEEVISNCHQCGGSSDNHTNCKNLNCNLLFIQCVKCKTAYDNCCSPACIEVVSLPPEKQKKLRRKIKNKEIFNSHKKVNLMLAFKK